jgi:hypothetical protein
MAGLTSCPKNDGTSTGRTIKNKLSVMKSYSVKQSSNVRISPANMTLEAQLTASSTGQVLQGKKRRQWKISVYSKKSDPNKNACKNS